MRTVSAPGPRRALVALALLACAVGCAKKLTRTLVAPTAAATLDSRSPFLKAHRADGGVWILSAWSLDSSRGAIDGTGTLLDASRTVVSSGAFSVPADSVVLFETNVVGASGPSVALTVFSGITAAIAGICATSPKTCFGSCPTFYAPGPDGEMVLQAEGFSSSIAPALEATDVDMLLHAAPAGREYSVRVTNEALETHVIRHADLLAVPRPPGGRVHTTSDGLFRQTTAPSVPVRCTAAEGDCLADVVRADGLERLSPADSLDLGAKETIDLEFDVVPEGELGLVLVSRQTLMTTFLIYQALAYMGDEAGRWLAALGSPSAEARQRAGGIGRALGGIEVLVPDGSGGWTPAGSVGETGPIATDTRVVPLALGGPGPRRVRLRLTKGLWRLDQVALVRLGRVVEPERIRPSRVTAKGVDDPAALQALIDPDRTLVTLPGDVYEISYQLPEDPAGHELFLETRGYYLEWMRREWMTEQNPLLAAGMVLDPGAALRSLAPAFKAQEPEMERVFWNSRYVIP
jgi:hypothetical protein